MYIRYYYKDAVSLLVPLLPNFVQVHLLVPYFHISDDYLGLKPVRIMLETLNLARKYTVICGFRKYTFQCLEPLNFADVSIFLQKISVFCPKKDSCVTDFLVLFSVFVRQKVTITENITFCRLCVRNPDSGLLRIRQKSKK